MSTDVCTRCPGHVWGVVSSAQVACDTCKSVWMSLADYIAEKGGAVKNKPGYIGTDLPKDLENLVQMVRITTMREVGGHLMNAYEQTSEKYKKSVGDKRRMLEGEIGSLHTIMEWLGGWADKLEQEMNDDGNPGPE